MKTVLICGDSFGVTDPDFPDLHFSEKILNSTPPVFEMHNLSHVGDSNALIALQLLQGLQFKPDFVILSFTTAHRHEIDNNPNLHYPTDLTPEALRAFRHERYLSSVNFLNPKNPRQDIGRAIRFWNAEVISDDFEMLRNYFLIHYCFLLLEKENIPFCYSIGGMVHQNTVNYAAVVDKNFIKNYLTDYADQALKINLWNHNCGNDRPYFHCDDDNIQTAFANECLFHMRKAGIV